MTTIKIEDRADGWTLIEIKGHALYNPGSDIVCASISTLAGILAGLCEQVDGANVISYKDGDCMFYLPKDYAVATVASFFKKLSEEYPSNVQVKSAE